MCAVVKDCPYITDYLSAHEGGCLSLCVFVCVHTHVNDHLSRLERIMRLEEPLQQGSAPPSFCSFSASLSRLAEVR